MNWWDILKNTKLSGKAKGKGTSFDASKIKINIDEDDKCNKKLQEWANKLKNYDLLMKKRYEGNKLLQKHFEISSLTRQLKSANSFMLIQKGANTNSQYHLHEEVVFFYKPVPEEVACKAIDMLEKSTTSDKYGISDEESIITIKGIEYEIWMRNQYNYQDNSTEIAILVKGIPKVYLGWGNGENTESGTDEYQRDFRGSENNVYDLSGYTEARKFGYSWWK